MTWCIVVWCTQTCTETAAVSCGTNHASAVNTPLRYPFKNALSKASHSCRITCKRSESAQEWRITLYKQSSINVFVFFTAVLPWIIKACQLQWWKKLEYSSLVIRHDTLKISILSFHVKLYPPSHPVKENKYIDLKVACINHNLHSWMTSDKKF